MQSKQYMLHSLLWESTWNLHCRKNLVFSRGFNHGGHLSPFMTSSSSSRPCKACNWFTIHEPKPKPNFSKRKEIAPEYIEIPWSIVGVGSRMLSVHRRRYRKRILSLSPTEKAVLCGCGYGDGRVRKLRNEKLCFFFYFICILLQYFPSLTPNLNLISIFIFNIIYFTSSPSPAPSMMYVDICSFFSYFILFSIIIYFMLM